jgi:ketosteroid isomerase-like protein
LRDHREYYIGLNHRCPFRSGGDTFTGPVTAGDVLAIEEGMRMRKSSLVLAALFAIAGRLLAGESAGEDEVTATLQAYESAWSRHDSDAISSFYYEPAMRVGRGGPMVRPTRADQAAFFSSFLPGLVRQGYANSTLEETNVRLLDERTAVASAITVRYKTDGTVLDRLGVTYGLYKTNDGWKIFMSATHAPESALHFR